MDPPTSTPTQNSTTEEKRGEEREKRKEGGEKAASRALLLPKAGRAPDPLTTAARRDRVNQCRPEPVRQGPEPTPSPRMSRLPGRSPGIRRQSRTRTPTVTQPSRRVTKQGDREETGLLRAPVPKAPVAELTAQMTLAPRGPREETADLSEKGSTKTSERESPGGKEKGTGEETLPPPPTRETYTKRWSEVSRP